MMRARASFAAVVIAFAALACVPQAADAQTSREIEHQAARRAVIITNAEAAKSQPKPLWVVLHGRRPAAQPNRSGPALDTLAKREGIVVAYPAAVGGKWNYVGEASPPSMVLEEPADDVGFLLKLIDTLVAEKLADPRRVYISGASQGAFMTYSLICQHAERFAAAAPMIASMTEAQIAACKPKRIVPIVAIAGTHDRVVPYDGWLTGTYRITSVPETMDFWRKLHRCSGQKTMPMAKRTDVETTRTHVVEWTGCEADGAMRLYRVEGGGHTLPSVTPQSAQDAEKMGRRSADFETSDEVWSFLKKWTLQ